MRDILAIIGIGYFQPVIMADNRRIGIFSLAAFQIKHTLPACAIILRYKQAQERTLAPVSLHRIADEKQSAYCVLH